MELTEVACLEDRFDYFVFSFLAVVRDDDMLGRAFLGVMGHRWSEQVKMVRQITYEILEKLDWQISGVFTLCTRVREESRPDD